MSTSPVGLYSGGKVRFVVDMVKRSTVSLGRHISNVFDLRVPIPIDKIIQAMILL